MAIKKSPQRLAYEREVAAAMKADRERRKLEQKKRLSNYNAVPDLDGRTSPALYDDHLNVVNGE